MTSLLLIIVLLLAGCATSKESRALSAYRWCVEHLEKYPSTSRFMECYCTPDTYGSTGRGGPMHCIPNYGELFR